MGVNGISSSPSAYATGCDIGVGSSVIYFCTSMVPIYKGIITNGSVTPPDVLIVIIYTWFTTHQEPI